MSTEQKLHLSVLIAKSRRTAEYLKEEVAILEGLELMEEAHAKAMLRVTHINRILRYMNILQQHEA